MITALRVLAATVLMTLVSTPLLAQSAGKRPVRVLTPATPGGPGDIQIRLLLPRLSEALGQTLIVDNRASNNGIVAMEIAAKSPPDAHTFAVGNSGTHAINASLYRKLPYDPVLDFAPVSQFSTTGMVFAANPRLPGTSIHVALQDVEVKERFRQLGLVTVGNTPQEFREVVARDVAKYRKIIVESGIPRL